MEKDSSFKRCFSKDITRQFMEELKTRSHSKIENHINIVIFGWTGAGKTSCGYGIAKAYNKGFSSDFIAFSNDKLIDKINDKRSKNIFMRDETPKKFGSGSRREEERIATIAQTMRKAELSLILIRPEFFYFPGAHFYLEALQMGKGYKNRMGVFEPNLRQYLGYIVIQVPKKDDKDWLLYQKMKNEFLETVRKDDFNILDIQKTVQALMNDPDLVNYKGKEQLKTFVKSRNKNLTNGEVSEIVVELHRRIKNDEKEKSAPRSPIKDKSDEDETDDEH